MSCFAYRGNARIVEMIQPRLERAGFTREGEVELADVVLTYGTTTSELEDLYFDDGGIVQAAKPRTLLIDMSPTTPQFATELFSLATISDLKMVEAPLVVTDAFADDALAKENLSCFAAGEEDAVVDARGLLDHIVGEVTFTGGAGSAQLARAMHTLTMTSRIVSSVEAAALARAAQRSVSHIACAEGPTLSSPMLDALANMRERRFESAYTTEMFMSELSAAIMSADDFEIIMPQAESAFNMLELLALIGGADLNPAALMLVYGNESDATDFGLDWSRAEGYFENLAHEHEHHHDFDQDDDPADDGYDYDDFDFSSN